MNKIILAVASCVLVGSVTYYGMSFDKDQSSNISKNNSQLSVLRYEQQKTQEFLNHTNALHQTLSQYCQADSVEKLATVQTSWLETMHSWMPLQGQGKGPKKALALSWTIQFWPDKKDITGRKMNHILQNPDLWRVESIKEQSVTVQGLGAMEWLLFDEHSEFSRQDKSYCQLALSISDNLTNHAEEINSEWQDNPWKALPESQWPAEYLGLIMNQLDFLLQKIQRPLAKIGHPRAYFSESWRSKQSLALMKSNIDALYKLYLAEGAGFDRLLRQKGLSDLADRLDSQFKQTLDTWPAQASLFDMLQTKDGYGEALAQQNKLQRLKYLFHDEAAVELGIVVGFNSTDGD